MNRIGKRLAWASPQQARGFTMMELIMTMVVLVVLMAIGAPAMQEFRIGSNVSTTTSDLVAALNLARAEAVKRGADVSVTANAGDWNRGWVVEVMGNGVSLTERGALQPDYRIRAKSTGGGADTRVTFGATGALRTATSFDLAVCRPTTSPGNANSRWITVSATGSIRSRRDTSSTPAGNCVS